ncbi:MAG: energy transducer TonB [Chitinophagaceae bacterium]
MDSNKILKSDYLDILFDGRNKNYGGYELRKNYPKRMRNAFAGLLMTALLGIALPVIAGFGNDDIPKPVVSVHPTILIQPPAPKNKPKILPIEPKVIAPVKPTFKLTPFVVKKDVDVPEKEKPNLPPTDERIAIGMANTKGDPTGIDPGLQTENGKENITASVVRPIYTIVEQMPMSPYDWKAYLNAHLQYPDDARQRGSEGRTVIQFVVNEDGSISNVELMKSSGSTSLDAEAKRVVAGMPKWTPGKQQGKAVKVYFSLPINFKIE